MNIAAFDLETNGYPGTSVLSASSIVFDEAGRLLAFFNRFYLPTEPFNHWLVRVHGLTLERLLALRARRPGGSPYFVEDWPDLMAFWDHWNVEGLVIHNARFDMAFLPEVAQLLLPCWCSMRGLTKFCALPGRNRFKPPRLSEAVNAVCCGPRALSVTEDIQRAEEAVGDAVAHVSLSDCFQLYRAAARVAANRPDWMDFKTIALPFHTPKGRPRPPSASPREDGFTVGLLDLERRLLSLGASGQGLVDD